MAGLFMSKVTMHWFMGLLQDDLVKIGCDHFIVVINIMISIYLNDDFYEIIIPEMYLEFYDLFYKRIISFCSHKPPPPLIYTDLPSHPLLLKILPWLHITRKMKSRLLHLTYKASEDEHMPALSRSRLPRYTAVFCSKTTPGSSTQANLWAFVHTLG